MDKDSHDIGRPPTDLSSRHSADQKADVLKRLNGKSAFIDDLERQRYEALLHGATPEERLLLARITLPRSLEQSAKFSTFCLMYAILLGLIGIGAVLWFVFFIAPTRPAWNIASELAICLTWSVFTGVVCWGPFNAYRMHRARAAYCRDKLIELAGWPPHDDDPSVISEEAAA